MAEGPRTLTASSAVQIHVESVIWADDIAIPLAINEATLVDSIEHVLQFVHSPFCREGFRSELSQGKKLVLSQPSRDREHRRFALDIS